MALVKHCRCRSFAKVCCSNRLKYSMETRKICPCGANPVAVNYIKENRTHYRSMCTACIHKGRKIKPQAPGWFRAGYRKKSQCEKCGFKAKYPEEQLRVFYLDGNLKNNTNSNLRTICLNCQQEVYRARLPWAAAGLVPDF